MDIFNAIKDEPMLLAAAVGALTVVGSGLRVLFNALVALAVRALDQVAPDHSGDRESLLTKVRDLDDQSTPRRKIESLMLSRMPGTIIDAAIIKREKLGRKPGE